MKSAKEWSGWKTCAGRGCLRRTQLLYCQSCANKKIVELTHEIQQIRARRRRHWPRIGSRLQKSKITRIQSAVSSSFGFTLADLLGDSLAQPLATVRGIAMALCTELPGASLPLIGEAFHRHHTTVLHAKQVLRFRMEDPRIAAVVKAVRSQRSTALK